MGAALSDDQGLVPSVVAFVDVLGTRAMSDGQQEEAFDRLVSARRRAEEFLEENPSYSIRTFTDNTLLRWTTEAPGGGGVNAALAWLPGELAAFQFAFAIEGILVRGAVEAGLLAITGTMIFGKALNDAYESETRKAFWPRIILSAETVAAVSQATEVATDYPEDVLSSLLVDEDGSVFIHYLTWVLKSDAPEFYIERHRDILLERLVLERSNPRAVEKIRWSIDYHNYAVTQMGHSSLTITEAERSRGFHKI